MPSATQNYQYLHEGSGTKPLNYEQSQAVNKQVQELIQHPDYLQAVKEAGLTEEIAKSIFPMISTIGGLSIHYKGDGEEQGKAYQLKMTDNLRRITRKIFKFQPPKIEEPKTPVETIDQQRQRLAQEADRLVQRQMPPNQVQQLQQQQQQNQHQQQQLQQQLQQQQQQNQQQQQQLQQMHAFLRNLRRAVRRAGVALPPLAPLPVPAGGAAAGGAGAAAAGGAGAGAAGAAGPGIAGAGGAAAVARPVVPAVQQPTLPLGNMLLGSIAAALGASTLGATLPVVIGAGAIGLTTSTLSHPVRTVRWIRNKIGI